MNILAIGAHFDDIELGCGGSLLKWKKDGCKISVFVATQSGYRDGKGKVIRSDKTAREEGVASAKCLGAKLHEGHFETFDLEFNEKLNQRLLTVLDVVRPEIVLTHWTEDVHHDHQVLAKATLHCCRHVSKLLMYRSNWYSGSAPFRSNFYVDISDSLEGKMELIKMHHSEFSRTKGNWENFVRNEAVLAGLRVGCKYAESFEVVRWLEV